MTKPAKAMIPKHAGVWIIVFVLITLPFALIAAMPLWVYGDTLWRWNEARGWIATPATLLESDLDVSRSGRFSSNVSYDLTGRYEYGFQGQTHRGTRMTVYGGGPGDYENDLHTALSGKTANAEPHTVYVNPRNPDDAVFNRDVLVGDMLLMAFVGLIGGCFLAGIIAAPVFATRRIGRLKKRAELAGENPDQPWLHRDGWAKRAIPMDPKPGLSIVFSLAVVTTAVAAPLFVYLQTEIARPDNGVALIGLLFPLAAACMVCWTVILIMRWRRFGLTVLHIPSLPVYIGDSFTGTIHAPLSLPFLPDSVKLTLRCRRMTEVAGGRHPRSQLMEVWREKKVATPRQSWNGTDIPVEFSLPQNQPGTNDGEPSVRWDLDAEAAVPGSDFSARFEVPIFPRAASRAPLSQTTF